MRHVLSVPVRVTRKPGETPTISGLMVDISEGGLATMLTEGLDVGEAVGAEFELPGVGQVSVSGVIRHKKLFRYGLEFLRLNERVRQQIRDVCKSLPRYKGIQAP